MKEPIWVVQADCVAIHEMALSLFGGLSGIRDEGLLDSALHRAQQLFRYKKPTLFQLAASYAHGIVKNHPFLDGNKRTAFLSAALFLEINGLTFKASEEQVVFHTRALAAGEESEADYAAWLEASCSGTIK